jgi:hypothetical protein
MGGMAICEGFGLIPRDDPVPYAALLHLVREKELATPVEIPKTPEESLPRPVYKAALAVVEGFGYDHGRHHADKEETAHNANTAVSVERAMMACFLGMTSRQYSMI